MEMVAGMLVPRRVEVNDVALLLIGETVELLLGKALLLGNDNELEPLKLLEFVEGAPPAQYPLHPAILPGVGYLMPLTAYMI